MSEGGGEVLLVFILLLLAGALALAWCWSLAIVELRERAERAEAREEHFRAEARRLRERLTAALLEPVHGPGRTELHSPGSCGPCDRLRDRVLDEVGP